MFWKRKKKNKESMTQEEMRRDVRDHHYILAHIALREACESDSGQFMTMMASEDAGQLVGHIWSQVCHNIPGEPERIDISTLQVAPCRVNDNNAVLIVMPQARRIAEAIMIMVVETNGIPGLEQTFPFRYFTLELGEDEYEQPCGVLAEWAGSHHLNYGSGPLMDAQGFKSQVSSFLSEG